MTTHSTLVDSPAFVGVPSHADLVGIPFRKGARGPNEYDCFGLLAEMYRRKGVAIHDPGTGDSQGENHTLIHMYAPGNWNKVAQAPGVAVLFRIGRFACHIGFVVDDMHFIHAWEGSGGVTRERLSLWKQRIVGFYDYRSGADQDHHDHEPS
jgi:hypothetical protein